MTKVKFLLTLFFTCFILICITTISHATNNVKVTRELYANNGSMKFHFTGLTLDTTHEYEFGLTKTAATQVEDWHLITTYTENTATIDISVETDDLREVINVVDTGYITIKDKTTDTVVLQPFSVDLKIPFLRVMNYTVIPNGKDLSNSSNEFKISIRCASNSEPYYQYQKITDQNIINKYKEIKEKNGNYLELESMLTTTVPTSNWSNWDYWNGYSPDGMNGFGRPERIISAPDTGLYYLWVYFSGDGLKDIYGYVLVDNLSENEFALERISLPETKKVELGETLQLSPTFTPSNATNKIVTWSSSDESVATVDNAGKVTPKKVGSTIITVTSQDGNKKATCTVTVTATSENNTNNKPNTDNNSNNNADNNKPSNNANNNQPNSNKGDSTTAPGTLPQTGESAIIALIIISVSIIGIITFIQVRKLKGIK